MQIPNSSRRRQDRGDEAMTPMIDVVFLLLIFFICAAAGQIKEAVLPTEMSSTGSVASEQAADRDPWIVEVWLKLTSDADGETSVDMNGSAYSPVAAIAAPLRTLADLSPENPVILQIDPNVPMRDVIAVYDLCESAGFDSVNFAARAEDLRPPRPQ
jgi:biopolymer transport protein ExbD